MKITTKVRVIRDNHAGDPFDSLSAHDVEIGDIGFVVDLLEGQYTTSEENILVMFEGDIEVLLAADELEEV